MPENEHDDDKQTFREQYPPKAAPAVQPQLPYGMVKRLIIMSSVIGLVAGGAGAYGIIHLTPVGDNITMSKQQLVVQESSATTDVVKKVSPAVVSITTKEITAGFFGQSQTEEGAGTGMIVTSDGLILTNKHVVPDGTSSVTVVDANGKQYSGSVVSRDPLNDIAFVRISAKNLPTVSIGDSGSVLVGQQVVAIGNALGQFQNSATAGIISGVSREIQAGDGSGGDSEELQNVFQTDAAINPGNSGGPLVNLAGQVIGMNTAVASSSQDETAQNIGFAIPMNDITADLNSVKDKGQITKPYLGVRYVQLTSDIASANNLPVSDGAWLEGDSQDPAIVAGGPADKAGLKSGDIITKVAGTAVDSTHSLPSLIANHNVGDKVVLTILRGGKTQTISVTLQAAPASATQ